MDDDLTPEEKLHIENEIEAMKQELDFGAETFISNDAPPEVVKMFLDNVRKFEEGYKKHKPTILKSYLGDPVFKHHKEIEDGDMEEEISKVIHFLTEKSVSIDRPEHLSPRGYYNFLVTDFLEVEMHFPPVPGMIHGFIYDEIRHDGKMYIEDHALETIEDIIDLSKPFQGEWLTEECRSEKKYVPKALILEKINSLRNRYAEIIPEAYSPAGIQQDGPFVYLSFGVHWIGILPDGSSEVHDGMGIAQLIFEDGEWMVQGLEMPGFRF